MKKFLKEEFPEQLNSNFIPSVLLIIGIFFISINLRTHIASVGPLLPIIGRSFYLSSSEIGLITTIPLIAFGLISPIVSNLNNKFGIEKMIFFGIVSILLTSILRVFTGILGFYFFTFILGAGLSICNVSLPALIKKDFPIHLAGIMTSMYTITFSCFGAISSALSVPIAKFSPFFGWKAGLLIWSVFALIATVLWIPQLNKTHKISIKNSLNKKDIYKSKKAWSISLFMGTSSSLLYIAMGWISEIMISRGFSEAEGGIVFSILQFAIMPATMFVPIFACKMEDQKKIIKVGIIPFLIGIIGFMIPTENIIFLYFSAIFYGLGYGCCLGLSMVLFNLKSKTPTEASSLSGMAQSIGYIMAAIFPIIFGKVFDITNSWAKTMIILIFLLILTFIFGLNSSKKGYIIEK